MFLMWLLLHVLTYYISLPSWFFLMTLDATQVLTRFYRELCGF